MYIIMNYYKIKITSHNNDFNKIVEVKAYTHTYALNACTTIIPENIKSISMEIIETDDNKIHF